MESLAAGVAVMGLITAGIGGAVGCGIGYGVSRLFDIPKIRCIILGGVAGLPIGFFSLPVIARLFG